MGVWSVAKGSLQVPHTSHFSIKKHTDDCFNECVLKLDQWATGRYNFHLRVGLEGETAFKHLQSWFNDIPGKGEVTYNIEDCK